MKIFCFILSIYILLLSLAPCSEMIGFAESLNEKSSPQTVLQTQHETNENGEDCSPFCICSCCHFSTVYQFKTFTITRKITVSPISRHENLYLNPYSNTFKNSVWQPPKFNSKG
ncbi:MAG: hypothetical protein LUM44_24345 [Pyrinomonadaceae bacterium]|nr:hypothetical protein [Pyrinomonadaceae bacterium]